MLQAEYSDLGGSKHWIGAGHFGQVYLCTVTASQFPLLRSTYDEKRRGKLIKSMLKRGIRNAIHLTLQKGAKLYF